MSGIDPSKESSMANHPPMPSFRNPNGGYTVHGSKKCPNFLLKLTAHSARLIRREVRRRPCGAPNLFFGNSSRDHRQAPSRLRPPLRRFDPKATTQPSQHECSPSDFHSFCTLEPRDKRGKTPTLLYPRNMSQSRESPTRPSREEDKTPAFCPQKSMSRNEDNTPNPVLK
jgi:hypothetical protein